MNIDRRIFAAVTAVILLSACSTDGQKSIASASFGEANRQTMMAQVIDPDPQYAEAAPKGSGEQAAAAVERYRKGAVKKPDRIRTSNVGAGGSSSGSN
ncbi:MAG: hypothetical protein ACK44O_03710 [Novosphingobium sp.]|jgi:hypothetical protein|uniref:hypothetical protein n=1 Tax=Novosphingobium sp. TaxID=1874826 RepID=UPI00391A750C